MLWIIIVFITLFFLIIGLINYIAQLNDKIAMKEDRIRELGSVNSLTQLNLHHIGNTLQWIQTKLDDEGASIVNYMFQNIGINLRKYEGYHSLKDELLFVKNYFLTVQSIFPDTLEFQIPDDETLKKMEDVQIFYMSIQLLCENSFKHGIQRRRPVHGFIKVEIEETPTNFRIIVEDNGVGFPAKNAVLPHSSNDWSYKKGTKVLRELKDIYDKLNPENPSLFQYEHGIFYNSTEEKKYGTRAIVTIPKLYQFTRKIQ